MRWSNEVLGEERKWYKLIQAFHKELASDIAEKISNLETDDNGILSYKVKANAILFDEKDTVKKLAKIGLKLLENTVAKFGDRGFGEAQKLISKGGSGSGNFGHEGRPGDVGGSGGGDEMSGTKMKEGKRVMGDGSPLPDHIAGIYIPPAWTSVVINPNPDANLLVKGKDSKGRDQYLYSEKFKNTRAEEKFARIKELNDEFNKIYSQNEINRKSSDPIVRDSADCLKLIIETGIRPGSDVDTKAAKKAYGATTLEGRYVVKDKSGVTLKFTGKKGVALSIPVEDPETSKMLINRANKAGPNGRLFSMGYSNLLKYTGSMGKGDFTVKDFRTYFGTSLASKEVEKMKGKPKNQKEYKKAVKRVARVVSVRLGNTPAIALQSYISPHIFTKWKESLL